MVVVVVVVMHAHGTQVWDSASCGFLGAHSICLSPIFIADEKKQKFKLQLSRA